MAINDFLSGVRDRVTVTQEEPSPDLPENEQAPPDPFEEIAANFDVAEDPKPARRAGKPGRATSAAAKATAAQKRAVADALEMMITLPAGAVAFKDPVCGPALLEHCDNIVKKLTPIVCRNPAMVAWFTSGAGYLDWLGLATALWPVASTVWGHHVTRSHDQEEDYGHSGGEPDFSHYTAPTLG